MTLLLLAVIYIAFISLGIPDSLLGTAWPVMYTELGVTLSAASLITMATSFGTIISSLISARLINKLGTAKVTLFSTLLTAFALTGFSFTHHYALLILLAIPLGLGGGAIDTALNNYVALHYSAMQMNLLHCFYGVGVSFSPYLMSLALQGNNWHSGYRMASMVQFGICLILFLSLPVWKKVKQAEAADDFDPVTLTLAQMAKVPEIRSMWIIFILTCCIEATAGTWGSSFLVGVRGLAPAFAARMTICYYVGMALGRLCAGLMTKIFSGWKLVRFGIIIMIIAMICLALPVPTVIAAAALFMIGFGNGPMFPNLNKMVPDMFGREISQSVMGSQMAACYVGILAAPALFGLLGDHITLKLFPYYLLIFLVFFAILTEHVQKMLKQKVAA